MHLENRVTAPKVFSCEYCPKLYTTKGNLNIHLKNIGCSEIYFGPNSFITRVDQSDEEKLKEEEMDQEEQFSINAKFDAFTEKADKSIPGVEVNHDNVKVAPISTRQFCKLTPIQSIL